MPPSALPFELASGFPAVLSKLPAGPVPVVGMS